MTQDSLNTVHEALLEALKIVSDAKRSAETAHAEALNAWRALSGDAIYVPFDIRMRLDATEKDLQLTKSRMLDGINKLDSLAASVARLQADAKKPPLADADSEWGPWIDWDCGRCPVPAGTWTGIRVRDGDTHDTKTPEAWLWTKGLGAATIVAYRVRQPVATSPASSEAMRVELAEALNRAEAAERDLEDVRKERDTHFSAYSYLATTAERDHNRVAELSAALKSLRAERDGASTALRDGLDPFAVVLATEGPIG